VSENADQLAILGRQVLDAIVAAYLPDGDSSLALALHPGQALADELVQNGQTNPLRLSEWIADQYDYPLWLKRADGTAVSASLVGGITAKAAYLNMVPWALPSVAVDVASFPRLNALIAAARRSLGDNPEALPFGCEPTDFAEADSSGWHVFDTKITSSTTVTETIRPDAVPAVELNPELWTLRPVPVEMLSVLLERESKIEEQRRLIEELSRMPRYEAVERLREIPDVMEYITQPAEPWTIDDAVVDVVVADVVVDDAVVDVVVDDAVADVVVDDVVNLAEVALVEPAPPPPEEAIYAIEYDPDVLEQLATIQLDDLLSQPVITETTTRDSELHVHFEYCLLAITRRVAGNRWWLQEFVTEDDWYVPGMKRGDMVKESTKEGYGHFLPQALLVVRNVSLTGSWTDRARESMRNGVAFLGPFLTHLPASAEASAEATEQVAVLGVGMQVIGELCAPLPPLPPRDDPELAPRTP